MERSSALDYWLDGVEQPWQSEPAAPQANCDKCVDSLLLRTFR